MGIEEEDDAAGRPSALADGPKKPRRLDRRRRASRGTRRPEPRRREGPAGEYSLRASKPGVAISAGATSLVLDHYQSAAPGAAPLPPPNNRRISELNFKTAGML